MAISVYSGVMGSGKSYEAVLNGLLPALKAGRRVVTNISGVSDEKCKEYLVARGSKPESLGSVVVVSNEAVEQPGFFPGEARERLKFDVPEWVPLRQLQVYADEWVLSQGKSFTRTTFQLMLPELKILLDNRYDLASCLVEASHQGWKTFKAEFFSDRPREVVFAELPDAGPSVVQPGDFVIIDEAWRYWSDQGSLSAEHMNFFRMHRHYVADNGVSCDLLILIQDFGSLNRFLRGVCELVLIFYKLKVLGFSSKYRVETYEGKPSKKTLASTSPMQKYRKEIFPLYKSYDGAKGKESTTDDRQNIFKYRPFQFVMIFAICGLLYSSWWFVGYVSRLRNGGVDSSSAPVAVTDSGVHSSSSSGGSSPAVVSAPGQLPGQTVPSDIRLVGVSTSSRGESVAILLLPDGRIVRQQVSAGVIDGWSSTVGFQGRMVSFTFGGVKK